MSADSVLTVLTFYQCVEVYFGSTAVRDDCSSCSFQNGVVIGEEEEIVYSVQRMRSVADRSNAVA